MAWWVVMTPGSETFRCWAEAHDSEDKKRAYFGMRCTISIALMA